MGTTTKSLESCWPCITNVEEELKLTNSEASVAYQFMVNKESSPLKLDLKVAQAIKGQSLETPDLQLEILNVQNVPSVNSNSPSNGSIRLKPALSDEKLFEPMSSNVNEMYVDNETNLFSVDNMDCVVIEEVVETSEFLESAVQHSAPTIVLMEAVDLTIEEDEVADFSRNLLTPGEIMEDCNSDHGYESHDSPISESDQLVNLFPELW